MDYGRYSIMIKIAEATEECDADKLDFSLRALDHYKCRGRSIDTTNTQYPAVLKINQKFYE
jgi:hypothetical protein